MLGAGQKKFGADWKRAGSRLRQDGSRLRQDGSRLRQDGSRQGKGGTHWTPREKSTLCTLRDYCNYLSKSLEYVSIILVVIVSMFEASLEKLRSLLGESQFCYR